MCSIAQILLLVSLTTTWTVSGIPVEKPYECGNLQLINNKVKDLSFLHAVQEVCCENYEIYVDGRGWKKSDINCYIYIDSEGKTKLEIKENPKYSIFFDDCNMAMTACANDLRERDLKKDAHLKIQMKVWKEAKEEGKDPVHELLAKAEALKANSTEEPSFEEEIEMMDDEEAYIIQEKLEEHNKELAKETGSTPSPSLSDSQFDLRKEKEEKGHYCIAGATCGHKIYSHSINREMVSNDIEKTLMISVDTQKICFVIQKLGIQHYLSAVTSYDIARGGFTNVHVIEQCGFDVDEDFEVYSHPPIDKCPADADSLTRIHQCYPVNKEYFEKIEAEGNRVLENFKSVVMAVKQKRFNINVQTFCHDVCYVDSCDVTMKGKGHEIEISFMARLGVVSYHYDDKTVEDTFSGALYKTVRFDSPGTKKIMGHCNSKKFKRIVILTQNEYCDQKFSGFTEIFSNHYCKNYKVLHAVLITFVVLAIMYYWSEFVAGAVSAVIGFLFFVITYTCFWKFYCMKCLKLKLSKGHVCRPDVCPACDNDLHITAGMSDKERKETMDNHMRYCSKSKNGTRWYMALLFSFRFFYSFFYFFFSRIPKIGMGTIMILVLYYMVSAADASFVDDVANRMGEMKFEKQEEKIIEMMDELKKGQKGLIQTHVTPLVCQPHVLMYTAIAAASVFLFLLTIYIMATPIRIAIMWFRLRTSCYNTICGKCLEVVDARVHEVGKECGYLFCPRCEISLGIATHHHNGNSNRFWLKHVEAFHDNETDLNMHINMTTRRTRRNITGAMKMWFFIVFFFAFFGGTKCSLTTHRAEMDKVEQDLSQFINDLKMNGFHPFHTRFTGGSRSAISSINEKKNCNRGTCKVIYEIESDMVVRPGREFGYTVSLQESAIKNIKLNMKITSPKVTCEYKEIYKTGKPLHKSVTGDTCTESCEVCMNKLTDEIKGVPGLGKIQKHQKQHPDSSSWACDGPWCMSMGSGCTCMKCWCEVKAPTHKVYEIVKETHNFDFCIMVGSQGFCRTVSEEERTKVLTVLEYEKNKEFCPKRIACKGHMCYKGAINGIDEELHQFGSVKIIGNNTISKSDIQAEEICHFGESRYYHVERCCEDTFELIRDLKPSYLEYMEDTKYKLDVVDLGSWKIRMHAPILVYHEEVDMVILKPGQITNCRGCHSCDEGGSCIAEFQSNLDHSYKLECSGCTSDQNYLQAKKGLNQISFNVFCKNREVNLTCQLDKFQLVGRVSLGESPKVPHGDGVLNIDDSKRVMDKCDKLFCGYGLPSLDFLGSFKTFVVTLVCIIILIVVVVILWKLYKAIK